VIDQQNNHNLTVFSLLFQEPYCDVSGLYENNEYLFRVCAVNVNGEGEYCETSSSIVAKMPFGKSSLLSQIIERQLPSFTYKQATAD
jgi:hypothetical protein